MTGLRRKFRAHFPAWERPGSSLVELRMKVNSEDYMNRLPPVKDSGKPKAAIPTPTLSTSRVPDEILHDDATATPRDPQSFNELGNVVSD